MLDGQQRLTSLYLALFGSYHIHKKHKSRKNEDKNFHISELYFNLTQSKKPESYGVKYEFLWLDKNKTKQSPVYIDEYRQKWFRCPSIYSIENVAKMLEFSKANQLEEKELELLSEFHTLIFNTQNEVKLCFYLEEEQNPDKAVDIFIRTNSGGIKLDYSDILFSIAIANWSKVDARTEINKLVDRINEDFSISKDLILRGFLYLFHHSIRFEIKNFDKGFIQGIEEKWEGIKEAFIATFKLLKSFGFTGKTLSSNNAVLPILYFIYHKGLTNNIVDSVGQEENRKRIKQYLLRSIIFQPFTRHSEVVLLNMRKAFIKDFKQGADTGVYVDSKINFPYENIEKEASYTHNIDEEYLQENILWYPKNLQITFAILSLLYPNLDYKNNNFHKDHLHPESAYKQYEKLSKEKASKDPDYEAYDKEAYNSLINLQLLDANENMSKNDKSLEQWVNDNCGDDRKGFLERHLIPDVDLSLNNFDEFAEQRARLLVNKLIKILNK